MSLSLKKYLIVRVERTFLNLDRFILERFPRRIPPHDLANLISELSENNGAGYSYHQVFVEKSHLKILVEKSYLNVQLEKTHVSTRIRLKNFLAVISKNIGTS